MPLTKPFRDTVRDRADRDPEFRDALVREFAKEVRPIHNKTEVEMTTETTDEVVRYELQYLFDGKMWLNDEESTDKEDLIGWAKNWDESKPATRARRVVAIFSDNSRQVIFKAPNERAEYDSCYSLA